MARISDIFSDAYRCRAFFCSTYLEHFDNPRTQIFEPLEVDKGFWILHDKDIKDDGSPKKPHYHLYLDFGNNSNINCDMLAEFLHVENMQFSDYVIDKPVQPVRKNAKACEDYMLHLGYPGFKYSPSEVKFFNCSSTSSISDVSSQLQRLLDWLNECKAQHLHFTYAQYLQELLNQGFGYMIFRNSFTFHKLYEDVFKDGKSRFYKESVQVSDMSRDEQFNSKT